MADVLAHHYTIALELSRAAGRVAEAAEVEGQALHSLALAGDRSMALNAVQAEAHYRKALGLARPGHPERARLLGCLAEAAQVTGNLGDAASLYDEAIAAYEAMGDVGQAADLMLRFAVVLGVRGEVARSRSLVDRVILDLEPNGPSPQLAQAYAEKAYPGWGMNYADAITWADRALELADRLDLPAVRARALAFRGSSRAGLGDPGGLEDMRSSLELSLSLGLARQTYVAYFNLVGSMCYEDPLAALEIAEEGLAFVRDRGLAEGAAWIRVFRLQAMFQLGHWEKLLAEVDDLIAWAQPLGHDWVAATASSPKAWVLSMTGRASEAAEIADASSEDPDRMGVVTLLSLPLIRGGKAVDVRRASRALEALIAEVEADPGVLLELLCEAGRAAAQLGRRDLLNRCEGLLGGNLAFSRHGTETWKGLSSELEGRHAEALEAFGRAERGWADFGHPYERAQAMVGEARCLVVLGRGDEGNARLRQASKLFDSLGAAPALRDVRALLAQGRPPGH
jgi:tetratricopeptide (TPR) repeat protein